jgi:hypothetical protein
MRSFLAGPSHAKEAHETVARIKELQPTVAGLSKPRNAVVAGRCKGDDSRTLVAHEG